MLMFLAAAFTFAVTLATMTAVAMVAICVTTTGSATTTPASAATTASTVATVGFIALLLLACFLKAVKKNINNYTVSSKCYFLLKATKNDKKL